MSQAHTHVPQTKNVCFSDAGFHSVKFSRGWGGHKGDPVTDGSALEDKNPTLFVWVVPGTRFAPPVLDREGCLVLASNPGFLFGFFIFIYARQNLEWKAWVQG